MRYPVRVPLFFGFQNLYFKVIYFFTFYLGGSAMSTKKGSYKTGRDARTGLFIPVREANRRKSTTVVETMKRTKKK